MSMTSEGLGARVREPGMVSVHNTAEENRRIVDGWVALGLAKRNHSAPELKAQSEAEDAYLSKICGGQFTHHAFDNGVCRRCGFTIALICCGTHGRHQFNRLTWECNRCGQKASPHIISSAKYREAKSASPQQQSLLTSAPTRK